MAKHHKGHMGKKGHKKGRGRKRHGGGKKTRIK